MSEKPKANLKENTKRSLKVMRRTNAKHPLRAEGRVIKYGAKGFSRNISLSIAATIVTCAALIVVFATIVANVILANSAAEWYDKIAFSIYLKPETTRETLEELSKIAYSDPNTKSVKYLTSEEEYKELLQKDYSEEELEDLGVDPETLEMTSQNMYATMEIKVYDADDLEGVMKTVEGSEEFQKWLDPRKEPGFNDVKIKGKISGIMRVAQTIRIVGIVVVAILLVIAVLVIFSTIRMAIFSRREEIYMMKLVGADRGFIRGPFLVEAEISGMIAGAVAAGVCIGGMMALNPWFTENNYDVSQIMAILNSWEAALLACAFVLAGILVGRIAAWLAVSKYLRKTS